MLARISDELRYVHAHVEECERLAADPTVELRADYARIAKTWRMLAESYDLAGRISDYLEWQSQRLRPPPDFK